MLETVILTPRKDGSVLVEAHSEAGSYRTRWTPAEGQTVVVSERKIDPGEPLQPAFSAHPFQEEYLAGRWVNVTDKPLNDTDIGFA